LLAAAAETKMMGAEAVLVDLEMEQLQSHLEHIQSQLVRGARLKQQIQVMVILEVIQYFQLLHPQGEAAAVLVKAVELGQMGLLEVLAAVAEMAAVAVL
jgi:hypothetical protein